MESGGPSPEETQKSNLPAQAETVFSTAPAEAKSSKIIDATEAFARIGSKSATDEKSLPQTLASPDQLTPGATETATTPVDQLSSEPATEASQKSEKQPLVPSAVIDEKKERILDQLVRDGLVEKEDRKRFKKTYSLEGLQAFFAREQSQLISEKPDLESDPTLPDVDSIKNTEINEAKKLQGTEKERWLGENGLIEKAAEAQLRSKNLTRLRKEFADRLDPKQNSAAEISQASKDLHERLELDLKADLSKEMDDLRNYATVKDAIAKLTGTEESPKELEDHMAKIFKALVKEGKHSLGKLADVNDIKLNEFLDFLQHPNAHGMGGRFFEHKEESNNDFTKEEFLQKLHKPAEFGQALYQACEKDDGGLIINNFDFRNKENLELAKHGNPEAIQAVMSDILRHIFESPNADELKSRWHVLRVSLGEALNNGEKGRELSAEVGDYLKYIYESGLDDNLKKLIPINNNTVQTAPQAQTPASPAPVTEEKTNTLAT